MDSEKLLGVEQSELRDLIATLLYEHDPMCGDQDCEYTARKIAPDIFEWFQGRSPTPENGLREALERANRALAFYADPAIYTPLAVVPGPGTIPILAADAGQIARSALQHNTGERD